MGGKVSRTGFEWSYTDEPHATRRVEILKKHPAIKKLMVTDHTLKYKIIAVVLFQLSAFYLVKDFSWGLTLLLAYVVAGVANHAILLGIHETAHNTAFPHSKPVQNKLFSIFVNLPIGVPVAVAFKKYHLDHHKYMGNEDLDVDLPTDMEAKLFTNSASKFIWVILQGFFYSIRPLIVRPLPVQAWEALNITIQISFDIFVFAYLGPKSLMYMIIGSFLGMGLHPVAAHFISEHYLYKHGFETYSYYGPLNHLTFNIGYHNEHHDFPNIPCSLLPKVREIAPEYYNDLPSHKSWLKVLFDFIFDPAIGPYTRMKRKNMVRKHGHAKKVNGVASHSNGQDTEANEHAIEGMNGHAKTEIAVSCQKTIKLFLLLMASMILGDAFYSKVKG
eukprot:Seg115.5 transcript_id=Seg115.5/GoldUCD/mRNA.D3Y31 product="Sphingolipid delta" protein_id=Seg115.5/GoldUCD/D3Y31